MHFAHLYRQMIFVARSSYEPKRDWGIRVGVQEFTVDIPNLPLTSAEYRIEVGLVVNDRAVDYIEGACRLKILGSDFYGTGKIPSVGFVVHEQRWALK